MWQWQPILKAARQRRRLKAPVVSRKERWMTKRLFGIIAMLFAVTAASACPGDKAIDDGKGTQDAKRPGTLLIEH
jgi:hypothetical protein